MKVLIEESSVKLTAEEVHAACVATYVLWMDSEVGSDDWHAYGSAYKKLDKARAKMIINPLMEG